MARTRQIRATDGDSWKLSALCSQVDHDIFYPEQSDSAAAALAKRVCGLCGVRERCLEVALTRPEVYGVWGGMSENERRKLLRGRA